MHQHATSGNLDEETQLEAATSAGNNGDCLAGNPSHSGSRPRRPSNSHYCSVCGTSSDCCGACRDVSGDTCPVCRASGARVSCRLSPASGPSGNDSAPRGGLGIGHPVDVPLQHPGTVRALVAHEQLSEPLRASAEANVSLALEHRGD